jgi:hypothetical protein
MKILTSGGWVKASLEEISIGTEKDTDIREVTMVVTFSTELDKQKAVQAFPLWIVETDMDKIEMFSGKPLNLGENMLAKEFAGPEQMEEKVAHILMDAPPGGGSIRVKKMTEDTSASFQALGHGHVQFMGLQGGNRVMVEGYFLGKKG